ncbi:MAG: pro-sigmaK processing inhibitor BofA family protein [Clostridia bacterium]|nr:pro-sigmaK processing inhibitor BofA family protein [Clostridia bacterium]
MTFLSYFIIIILCITAFLTLIFSFKSLKPLKFLVFNAFLGITTLLILYLTRKFTGLNIAINHYTVISSSFLGLPAVLLLLIINIITLM